MKFEPVFCDFAAREINERPWTVSRSADLLAKAHLEAMRAYDLQSCIVGVDIYNVEAEAYGCSIQEPSSNGVPAVGDPLFSEIDEILSLQLDPLNDGRLPMVFEAARVVAREAPDAEIRIPMSGPFSIACKLLGMEDLICELFEEPEPVEAALLHLAENQLTFARAALENGFSITFYESTVTPPILSPNLFKDSVLPALNRIFTKLNHNGQSNTQFVVGGNTLPILDAITSLPLSYLICPVETNQKAFMAALPESRTFQVRINMDPSVFLPGNTDAALIETKRVMTLAVGYGNTSIGALIPFEADPTIIKDVNRMALS